MSKKAFVVILILSVVVTYLTPALQILISGLSFVGKDRGLPFNFVRYSFSGSSTYIVGFFVLDVIFWFVIIFFIWKVLKKIIVGRNNYLDVLRYSTECNSKDS